MSIPLHSPGLTNAEAAERLRTHGPNLVHTYSVRWFRVLLRQVRSPLLVLLAVTTVLAFWLGQQTDAVIITMIMAASVVLGFINEYRAERTAVDLHARMQHTCTVVRDGITKVIPVSEIVPGDVVVLTMGCVVPADGVVIEAAALECNESILTGESALALKFPVAGSAEAHRSPRPPEETEPSQTTLDETTPRGTTPGETAASKATAVETTAQVVTPSDESRVLMGTVVAAGLGRMLVTATGTDTAFGKMSVDLGLPQPLTGFQAGLRRFSMLLLFMAALLVAVVLAANIALQRPWVETLLFALAICVGITPQMLPAVVSISLATGARHLADSQVLVKRLISIEDLGDIEVLFTDKTGTLTEGDLQFLRAINAAGQHDDDLLPPAVLACAADARGNIWQAGMNPLDAAVWKSAAVTALVNELPDYRQVDSLPFDHIRQRASRMITSAEGSLLLVKGAAESVLPQCVDVPATANEVLAGEYGRGSRVIALASRPWEVGEILTADSEAGLQLLGFLVFEDPVKESAAEALRQLRVLGIDIKVLTGDHPVVAQRVCAQLGLHNSQSLTGAQIDQLSDAQLAEAVIKTSVFARLTPQHKVRIVRAQRAPGADVAFLGDGVNDAPALHEADVGISVSNATDVAQDAADIILLRKDLGVLANGVNQGRRVFANTIRYVLIAASSNFGNMFSAAGASAVLPFLPMLPGQVLLNNLLYDASQLSICSDNADAEQLRRPSHWDMRLIRRYMLFFGLISSLFDFGTFAVLLWLFDAPAGQFQAGWFAESLATQTLVVLVIRTRRSPFWRSRPSAPLMWSVAAVVFAGAVLPNTPVAAALGFIPLTPLQALTLAGLVVVYLAVVEVGKRALQDRLQPRPRIPFKVKRPHRRIRRRLRRFTSRAA